MPKLTVLELCLLNVEAIASETSDEPVDRTAQVRLGRHLLQNPDSCRIRIDHRQFLDQPARWKARGNSVPLIRKLGG